MAGAGCLAGLKLFPENFAALNAPSAVKQYDKRLPHREVIGQSLFVTFRLHGTLPASRPFAPQDVAASGKAFVAMDRILDQAATGPAYLQIPEIAEVVVAALRAGEQRFQRYQLHAYVVMPNHVHALVTPNVFAAKWLGPLKGFTAHEANRILGRRGEHFWQDESYDHLVRSGESERIRLYIEQNPVGAGLVAAPENFRWSSAYQNQAG